MNGFSGGFDNDDNDFFSDKPTPQINNQQSNNQQSNNSQLNNQQSNSDNPSTSNKDTRVHNGFWQIPGLFVGLVITIVSVFIFVFVLKYMWNCLMSNPVCESVKIAVSTADINVDVHPIVIVLIFIAIGAYWLKHKND